MGLWFAEKHTPGIRPSIRMSRQLYNGQNKFQRTDVSESEEFGRFLALSGYMMLTERGEFIYHEIIAHILMAVHPKVWCILVIGSDDGGVVCRLIHYPGIGRINLVKIDEQVVTVHREHLPFMACSSGDPRVKLHSQDNLRLVRRQSEEYDLILVSSTDPFSPGEGLFTRGFYNNCYKALGENGIVIDQHENSLYTVDALAMQRTYEWIMKSFPISRVYWAHIPTYPSGR